MLPLNWSKICSLIFLLDSEWLHCYIQRMLPKKIVWMLSFLPQSSQICLFSTFLWIYWQPYCVYYLTMAFKIWINLSVMNTYSSSSLAKHLSEKCWLNLQFLAMYYITIPLHWYFSENYYILLPKEYVQLIIILLPTKCYVKTKAFTKHYHKLC